MRKEILEAIEKAQEIERLSRGLIVGTGRKERFPKDEEGNIVSGSIMIHFDAARKKVSVRTHDEEGDPWGFEFTLPVAEALGLALNDLLGLFDSQEADRVRDLEKDLSSASTAARIIFDEKQILEKKIKEQSAEIKDLREAVNMSERMLGEPGFKAFISKRLADLEHFAASVSGLYATDRPDLVKQSLFDDAVLFKIEPPEAKK